MYSYTYDIETGGLLLNSSPLQFSKEPRPVYYREMDILGFDAHWQYEKNDFYPYMWAEANNYWYRGKLVAKTKGGALYTSPEVIFLDDAYPIKEPLRFVDIPAMVAKNAEILESLTQATIKKIYNSYIEYQHKVDVFYVAFSGGKDSIVLFDLVQKALPHNAFKVIFADTGMEFSDTYLAIDNAENFCSHQEIDFYRSKSEYAPETTWNIFGSPSTVNRWCCCVHKTAPQIILLRKILGKTKFVGFGFIGVRGDESLSRSKYDYICYGEKHKGQYSCNPILDWNSAEVFLYIFAHELFMNPTYKKGNRRAGCLVCPCAAERNDFMNNYCYSEDSEKFINIIRNLYRDKFQSKERLEEFIVSGGWKARKNGRDLSLVLNYKESKEKDSFLIHVTSPRTDWREWIKSIGELLTQTSPYAVLRNGKVLNFSLEDIPDGYNIRFDASLLKEQPEFVKLLKEVFRKAACCIGCKECEADCSNGYISFINGQVKISNSCTHCALCHKVDKGCLVYKSLEISNGGFIMNGTTKSLNCYSHFSPKMKWLKEYFEYKNEFNNKHDLGSQMFNFFKRFLRDSNLLDGNGFSSTAAQIDKIGYETVTAWGILFVNLCYTPQVNWLVKRVNFDEQYTREYLTSILIDDGAKETWVNDIWISIVRMTELPLSEIGFGTAIKEKSKAIAIVKHPWSSPEPLVILYALYKFAEGCKDYYQFTLTRLLDHEVESDGVSPTQIFGLSRETMEKLLNGLAINYPEFISVSFNLDLDNITLRNDKTSADVLNLF
ncbi:MAG: phosphoadenosine phosphosulfate reductase family protein [Victivallaceae bacterium]